MLNFRAWVISLLLSLPLWAQDTPVPGPLLPDNVPLPAVDRITSVPGPEIPLGISPENLLTMPKDLKINNQGGKIEGSMETGVRFGGPVKVEGDNGLQVFSDTALLDLKEKTVTFDGNVSIYQGNLMQRGQHAVYFYERKLLDTRDMRASVDPVLLEAGKFTAEEKDGKKYIVGENAGVTTDDVQNPSYWVRSAETRVYPGDKIVFNDLRLYWGDTPVLWLPFYSQPLDPDLGYHFLPGARSNWGGYLLNTYGVMLGGNENASPGAADAPWLLSKWHFDIRTQRGLGVGLDLIDKRLERTDASTGLSMYYLSDLSPEKQRSGVPRGFVNEDRYKIELKQQAKLDWEPDAKWRLDSNLTFLSDEYYLEDFEVDRYKTDPSPDNTFGIFRQDEGTLLSLYMRVRLNDFYRTDTRLPEVAFDQARAPLFDLPLLHEGKTSFSIITEQPGDQVRNQLIEPLLKLAPGDPKAPNLLSQLAGYEREIALQIAALPIGDPRRDKLESQLLDESYARFNTYQELSLPMNIGFLTITPEAGVGYTYYGAVDGPADNMDRTTLHFGTEAALKFSKQFGSLVDHDDGLNGMLHVMQPYTSWSIISTDDIDPYFPAVDRLTASTRPRPIDPIRFTAVDEMNNWNIFRMGVRNRLLTKRDGQSYEWLFMNTYIDGFIQDPEGNREFSNLNNDIRWHPVPWMSLDFETQFPVVNDGSGFTEVAPQVRFLPNENTEWTVGYRMLNNHPTLLDSNRVDLGTYSRLNEDWGFGTRHVLEMDDGTLELQQYSVYRDFGSWIAGLGLTYRDNRLREEYGVAFSLTLKDFPSVSLPFKLDAE